MRKVLTLSSIISILAMGCCVIAITVGIEPPAEYINRLVSCTKFSKQITGSTVEEFTINGILPDGRCEVVISSYTNFADKKVWEGYMMFARALANGRINDSDLPTQQQMIEQGKKEKITTICKFTKEQRQALYNAYAKHDGTNGCTTSSDGSQHCEFSTSKMSSYDKLMVNYQMESCTQK